MKRNKTLRIVSQLLLAMLVLSSCSKYDDYISDYDYPSVGFGAQTPVRTIVARETMAFEIGATLGGLRADDGSTWVDFVIDTSLLSSVVGADGFTLLPKEYYTLSCASSVEYDTPYRFDMVKQMQQTRVTKLTLNRALFTADSLSLDNNYALPLRLVDTSMDSIREQDYTIAVVKYVSAYHGTYYSRGQLAELDSADNVIYVDTFYVNDLSKNEVKDATTLGLNTISFADIGGYVDASIDLTINADNIVDIVSDDITISAKTVVYDTEAKKFDIDMKFVQNGVNYHLTEELTLRQDPEKDLRFEWW